MLGYDYELADGSVRAKLYYNGVLFVDSAFDKAMRANWSKAIKNRRKSRAAGSEGKRGEILTFRSETH